MIKSLQSPSFKNFLWIAFGAFILCSGALFSGYPLLYSDSAAYLRSGFTDELLLFKPSTYGLFLRHISMGATLWFPVILQALMGAWLLFRLVEEFSNSRRNQLYTYFVSLLVLVLFTGLTWYIGQITPDIFSAFLLIGLGLFFFGKKLKNVHRVFVLVMVFISAIFHLSHLFIYFLILISLGIWLLWLKVRKKPIMPGIIRRGLILLVLWVISVVSVPSLNYLKTGQFQFLSASHITPISKLVHSGILEDYLEENCGKPHMEGMEICKYQEDLSRHVAHFLWNPNSVIFKLGGYQGCKEEFQKLTRKVYGDPAYWGFILGETIRAVHMQFFELRIGDGLADFKPGSVPHQAISKYFPHEYNDFNYSWQINWKGTRLNFEKKTQHQLIFLFLCLILTAFGIVHRKKIPMKNHEMKIAILLLWGIYVNAWATAGLHVPIDRYQARVAWIFPLLVLVLLLTRTPQVWKALKSSVEADPDTTEE